VQRKFWSLVPDERYVANPAKGSRHNRGAAVDLTLVDQNGQELPMPTPFDDFTDKAHRDYAQFPTEALKKQSTSGTGNDPARICGVTDGMVAFR
jgi:D-alanyl-D-alanine dipeptidase